MCIFQFLQSKKQRIYGLKFISSFTIKAVTWYYTEGLVNASGDLFLNLQQAEGENDLKQAKEIFFGIMQML